MNGVNPAAGGDSSVANATFAMQKEREMANLKQAVDLNRMNCDMSTLGPKKGAEWAGRFLNG